MKRILLINGTYVGFHVFLRGLAERLSADSWEVHVATDWTNYPGEHRSSGDESFTHHEIKFPRGANLLGYRSASRRISQIVSRIQPSIIHAHMHPAIISTALASSPIGMRLGTYQGLIGPTLTGFKARLYSQIERWATGRLDQVWVLTDDDLAALPLENVALQKAPGFGADQTRFDPARFTAEDRQTTRVELGIPEDATMFLFLGRQTVFKGFPEVAKTAILVSESYSNAHFLFVGTPDPRHPTGLEKDFAGILEQSEQIHMLGWNDDVPRLMNAVDCMVFPSEREGLSVCIMEALSMGVPVITTSARGCGDLIADGHNGWIVEKSFDAVAGAVENVCRDPCALGTFRDRILAERTKYSREHFIREQIANYERVVESL